MHSPTFHILLILSNGARHANDILERLGDMPGEAEVPSLASFYRCLKGALDSGWVEVAGNDPAAGPGRPRKIYRMTEAGRGVVEAEAARLQALAAMALGPRRGDSPRGGR